MHPPTFLLLVALACLAAASPVAPTNHTTVVGAKTSGVVKISARVLMCSSDVQATVIRVERRDVPYNFDVKEPFRTLNADDCLVVARYSGFHGAVYRSDSKLCHLKNLPQIPDRVIVDDHSNTRLYGVDIPGYDINKGDGWSDLSVEHMVINGRTWFKQFPYCDVCTMMVWQCFF
ncbi:hypothetical protein BC828DRAFT_390369 [Blastocladiella britannica]|nr:hypothetical protein BC828DRAFT_390369 [Blastocladiella britannica]